MWKFAFYLVISIASLIIAMEKSKNVKPISPSNNLIFFDVIAYLLYAIID